MKLVITSLLLFISASLGWGILMLLANKPGVASLIEPLRCTSILSLLIKSSVNITEWELVLVTVLVAWIIIGISL